VPSLWKFLVAPPEQYDASAASQLARLQFRGLLFLRHIISIGAGLGSGCSLSFFLIKRRRTPCSISIRNKATTVSAFTGLGNKAKGLPEES
jgi:hypothetical protein